MIRVRDSVDGAGWHSADDSWVGIWEGCDGEERRRERIGRRRQLGKQQ
jgi:hypothetical protein